MIARQGLLELCIMVRMRIQSMPHEELFKAYQDAKLCVTLIIPFYFIISCDIRKGCQEKRVKLCKHKVHPGSQAADSFLFPDIPLENEEGLEEGKDLSSK